MKHFSILFLALPLLLCSCEEDSGRTINMTSDGITMEVQYTSYYCGLRTLDERDEADIHVYATSSKTVDSTALHIDGNIIETIDSLPWHRKYTIGLLNSGDHEFWLIHTHGGKTDTLSSRCFTNDNRGILNIFYPSN